MYDDKKFEIWSCWSVFISNFANESKPLFFALTAFDKFTDLMEELPTVISFLAAHSFFERQWLGSILLWAMQSFCRCSEKSEKLFLAAPPVQEKIYLNLGFKEIDFFSDLSYSEMDLNIETVCFLQNDCIKKKYCDEEGKQYCDNEEFKNLGYFILNGLIKEPFFSCPLSI